MEKKYITMRNNFRKSQVNMYLKNLKKRNLRKWKLTLLIIDKSLIFIIFLLLGAFKPDYLVLITYFLTYLYLIFSHRIKFIYYLILSSIISLIWMSIAKDFYNYNMIFLKIRGINLYPLVSWSLGLFAVYLIYLHWEHLFNKRSFLTKFLFFTVLYISLLIIGETIAYHLFNIKNLATSNFKGLPICNCIHAPLWMQLSYFILGPIYFLASKVFEKKLKIKKYLSDYI